MEIKIFFKCKPVFSVLLALAIYSAGGANVFADEARFSKGVLWQIEASGGETNYLFGTLHVDDDKVLTLPAVVAEAFNQADSFAAEVIADNDSSRRFNAAMLEAEPALPALLGAEAYKKLDELLGEYRVPPEIRPRFKPWAAMLTLQQPRKRNATIVLDNLLLRNAAQHKKNIIPLETIDEQIAAFNGMSAPTQLALLRYTQANHRMIQNSAAKQVEAYLQRDLEQLMRLSKVALPTNLINRQQEEEFFERILFDRSRVMAERLTPRLQKGGLFAAFGALHLYGERGVLNLLEQQGFSVKKIY